LLDKLEELLGSDHRPRVAGEKDDRERVEHGVDRSTLEPKLAEVCARQQRTWCLQELRSRVARRMCCHAVLP
jgi:hypothetical protein